MEWDVALYRWQAEVQTCELIDEHIHVDQDTRSWTTLRGQTPPWIQSTVITQNLSSAYNKAETARGSGGWPCAKTVGPVTKYKTSWWGPIIFYSNPCSEGALVFSSVCLSIYRHNNSRAIRDRITKFSEHHPMVKVEAKFENGCTGVHSWWFKVTCVRVYDWLVGWLVVGHSLLLARLPGTHWVTICVIRWLELTVSGLLKMRLFSEY